MCTIFMSMGVNQGARDDVGERCAHALCMAVSMSISALSSCLKVFVSPAGMVAYLCWEWSQQSTLLHCMAALGATADGDGGREDAQGPAAPPEA